MTSTDYINVIQYYCQFPDRLNEVDAFRLSSLRDIEKAIGVDPLETVSVHPMQPLYEACRRMIDTRARRIPLIDIDDETGKFKFRKLGFETEDLQMEYDETGELGLDCLVSRQFNRLVISER